MATNIALAAQFDELADRLLLDGESWFKVVAYRRAADTLRSADKEASGIAAEGRLGSLPGIGDAITEKIGAFLATGRIPLLERLRSQQPAGLLELMRETGLRPRLVRAAFSGPLQIRSAESLARSISDGTLKSSGVVNAAGLRSAEQWLSARLNANAGSQKPAWPRHRPKRMAREPGRPRS